MLLVYMIRISFVLSISAGLCFASQWSESMVQSIKNGALNKIEESFSTRVGKQGLELDFVEVSKGLLQHGSDPNAYMTLNRFFARPLLNSISEDNLTVIADMIKGNRVPEPAKQVLFETILKFNKKSKGTFSSEIQNLSNDIQSQTKISSEFKKQALLALGRNTSLLSENLFLPYLTSSDSSIKTAAYMGLCLRLRANTMAERHGNNPILFHELQRVANLDPNLMAIRALSNLDEVYALDYLETLCGNDPFKLEIVLRAGAKIGAHPILNNALNLLGNETHRFRIASAFRFGFKNAKEVISGKLKGSNAEMESALRLLSVFPEYIPEHKIQIDQLRDSPNPALRDLALALYSPLTSRGK
jgi:hypothetical protein